MVETKKSRPPINSVEIIEVIRVEVLHGRGTEEDIYRTATEYWSKDGEPL